MSSSSSSSSQQATESSSSNCNNSKPITTAGASNQSKWKTPGHQRMYSRRLVDALRGPHPKSARAIKDAADSALALTARGQSLWSRSILTSRRRPKILLRAAAKVRRKKPKKPARKVVVVADEADGEPRKLDDRLKKLGRLVPGCGKLPTSTLLEEAADYVAALEMQVRTMRALAEALSAASLLEPPAAQEEPQQQHHSTS